MDLPAVRGKKHNRILEENRRIGEAEEGLEE